MIVICKKDISSSGPKPAKMISQKTLCPSPYSNYAKRAQVRVGVFFETFLLAALVLVVIPSPRNGVFIVIPAIRKQF